MRPTGVPSKGLELTLPTPARDVVGSYSAGLVRGQGVSRLDTRSPRYGRGRDGSGPGTVGDVRDSNPVGPRCREDRNTTRAPLRYAEKFVGEIPTSVPTPHDPFVGTFGSDTSTSCPGSPRLLRPPSSLDPPRSFAGDLSLPLLDPRPCTAGVEGVRDRSDTEGLRVVRSTCQNPSSPSVNHIQGPVLR